MSKLTPKFTIETINAADKDEVYKFALEYFIKDEPLCSSVGLFDCPEIKDFILNPLVDNCSFKAVTEKGDIIGIVISGIKKLPEKVEHGEIENEKWKKMAMLLEHCAKEWSISELYPNADIILDGKIIAVDPNYRGLGIAGQLIQKCRDYMHENNIPLMKRICSSKYSARVMEKLGMREVHKLAYKDFKVNGEVLFKPAAPHVEIRTFLMSI